jgi:hypothetical protein
MLAADAHAQIPKTIQAGPAEDEPQEMQAPPPSTNVKERQLAPGQEKIAREGPMTAKIEAAPAQGPNIRIELTLTEQLGTSPSTSKTVMLTTGDGQWGRLRSQVFRAGAGSAPLNLDARPLLLKDGRISCSLTVEYSPDAAQAHPEQGMAVGPAAMASGQTRLDQSLSVVLQSGQPLLVTQAADAVSDRKVTVEVKATVLK